jgi:hypothetical protein
MIWFVPEEWARFRRAQAHRTWYYSRSFGDGPYHRALPHLAECVPYTCKLQPGTPYSVHAERNKNASGSARMVHPRRDLVQVTVDAK